MPTAYTYNIKDGIDFKTYAMNCATAFGACVELRELPGGGEKIPEVFSPSEYHKSNIEKLEKEYFQLISLTPDQWTRASKDEWLKEEQERLKSIEDNKKLRASYEAMLQKAKAWTPPSPEHEGLYTFMCQQIEESIKFDCGFREPKQALLLSGKEWFDKQMALLQSLRKMYTERKEEDIK